jgi:Tfp pilus assembly protein PilE
MAKFRSASGTHLLELAIAMFLLSILAGVSYPALKAFSSASCLKQEARRIALLLSSLSMEALQSEQTVTFSLGYASYSITRGIRQTTGQLQKNVSFDLASSTGALLSFYPSGAASPATLTFKSGDRSCTLSLSLRGRVNSNCL